MFKNKVSLLKIIISPVLATLFLSACSHTPTPIEKTLSDDNKKQATLHTDKAILVLPKKNEQTTKKRTTLQKKPPKRITKKHPHPREINFYGKKASKEARHEKLLGTYDGGLFSYFHKKRKALYHKRCIDVEPQEQKLRSLSDTITDYMAGMFGSTWEARIKNHYIGLMPMYVYDNGDITEQSPKLYIFKNYFKSKREKPTKVLQTTLNVIKAKEGYLYRIYIKGKSQLKCIDMAVLNANPFKAAKTTLYYRSGKTFYSKEFQFKMLN